LGILSSFFRKALANIDGKNSANVSGISQLHGDKIPQGINGNSGA
jgi:hypothetical protein